MDQLLQQLVNGLIAGSIYALVAMGLALIFGIIITIVACQEAFEADQGAVGVGLATRRAVIVSFLFILVMGYFVTRLFYV